MAPPVLYTGINLHERTLTATTLDRDGAVVASAKLPRRRDGVWPATLRAECRSPWRQPLRSPTGGAVLLNNRRAGARGRDPHGPSCSQAAPIDTHLVLGG